MDVLLTLLLAVMLTTCGVPGSIASSAGAGGGGATTTVPPPQLTVTLTPSTVSLFILTTQKFGAVVSNATNTAVIWTVNNIVGGNSTVGTIDTSGMYTAPSVVPVPSTVTITVTSIQDPTKSASALAVITTTPLTIQVNITPSMATVQTGGIIPFNAQVTGTTNSGVTWFVNGIPGGNSSVGFISGTGLYTAPALPPSPANVTITATSVANPNASGTANATVQQRVQVSILPTMANVTVGTSLTLMSAVTGTPNTTVRWSVAGIPNGNSTVGTISGAGVYTAPATVPSPATVTVIATSQVDPTAFATALVSIVSATQIAVSVGPSPVSVATNAIQQFNATVTGTPNMLVTWLVNGIAGGNGTVGSISQSGLYTAPSAVPLPNTVTVTAVSLVDPTASGSATVMVNGSSLVSVSVSPSSSNLQPGGSVQFFATVTGSSNLGVTWRVNGITGGNSVDGTITAGGVYTAPNIIPSPATVTITATSIADPTASGVATLTLIPPPVPVAVQVTPSTASLHVNNQFQFSVAVTGTSNSGVTWSVNGVNGGNASVGTITSAGLYVAPASVPAGGAVNVKATSLQDPTKSSSSTVTILAQATITMTPATVTVQTGLGAQFFVVVTGLSNTAVAYTVNNVPGGNSTVGTINSNGLYVAPATVPNPATVTVTATSVVDPTVTTTSTVTIAVPVTVITAPPTASIGVGQMKSFAAMVTGTTNTGVNWSVNGIAGGNASVGTIDVNGNYTAPASLVMSQSFTITATSVVNAAAMGSSTVTVTVPVSVVVSPNVATVVTGGMLTLTATVAGTSNLTVTWAVNGVVGGNSTVGTITSSGLYTAPTAVPAPATVTMTATSQADPTKSGTAMVTISAPVVTISISPSTATISVNGVQPFTAMIGGTSNLGVTWAVNGVVGGNSTVGTITSGGVYTAPAAVPTPATIAVTGSSVADPTKSANASVTIVAAPAVTVGPTGTSVLAGRSQQFTATVTGTANLAVTWAVNGVVGGNGTVGTISSAGLYTAPVAVPSPPTVTITATSVSAPTASGSTTTTILAAVGVSVSPTSVTLLPGQTQTFTPMVTGTSNTAVTWSVNGITGGSTTVGTVSTSGLYTAPASPPTPAIVSVTATSVADPTKSATAAVTLPAPANGIFVTVFPRNRTLPIGRTQQFKSHVFLTTNLAVNWQVNGIAGGNSTFGTIDTSGLYTPPTTLPASPMIKVRAVSQQDPTKFEEQNETIVAGLVVDPISLSIHINDTQQFTVTVNGVSNTAVTWAVNGVVGGNITVGTISSTGLYTAPAAVPPPGFVSVTATSTADPTEPGLASVKVYPAKMLDIFPTTASLLPGQRLTFQHHTNLYYPTTAPNFGLLVNFSVNGILGGNATVGTITPWGLYTAPLTPQTVTVSAKSVVAPSFSVNATVTVTAGAAPSASSLMDTLTKIRPYDIVSGKQTLGIAAAQQEYADWQVVVTGNGEDLSNVDVSVSNFTDGKGNQISSSNAVIYFQKQMNVFYLSRLQYSDVGEWPDALVPKVDVYFKETRNAFPFSINRISPAYHMYPIAGGSFVTNNGWGAGTAKSSGTYTGSVYKLFNVIIDTAGTVGGATFKWSTDGGTTFQQTRIATSANPVALSDGVSVSFQPGNIAGVTDFNVGDNFWISAGPLRNQGVWVDLYVPSGTPAGNYTGTVTVTAAGKSPTVMTVNLQVYAFAIPVSSSIPVFINGSWQHYIRGHYLINWGPQIDSLGQLYGTACLIHRVSCSVSSAPAPTFTFNANDTVNSANFSGFDQVVGPLLDGTITPHGEQLSTLQLQTSGGNETQIFFSTQSQLAHFVSKGWRSRVFDYSFDEPGPAIDFQNTMSRASLVRSVDTALRTLVTTDINMFNFNLKGYVTRYVSNWTHLGDKDFENGPIADQPPFYASSIAQGDELWWYDSCTTVACSTVGGPTIFDNYPNSDVDTSALMNRVWGYLGQVPYNVSGYLYYDHAQFYPLFMFMTPPRVDVWDSVFAFSDNGDGTFFYPGRPSIIGGTTHIPVESMRIKFYRDSLVDMEYGLRLRAQGDTAFLESTILSAGSDLYTYDANPATWVTLRKTLGQKIK